MVNRVKFLINEKSKSVREFAEMIGVKQVTLNQQIAGDRKLSLDVISSILNTFQDVSSEWLLRGKGDMFNSEIKKSEIKAGDMQKIYETVIQDKDEQIEEMKTEINKLIGENSIMREQLGIASRKASSQSA